MDITWDVITAAELRLHPRPTDSESAFEQDPQVIDGKALVHRNAVVLAR